MTVTEIVAENNCLSLKDIAEKAEISLSTALRVTEILLNMDILSEKVRRQARYFGMSRGARFFIFDISALSTEFYVVSESHSVMLNVRRKYRYDILPSDNLSLFFRDCRTSAAKSGFEPTAVCVIMSDENFGASGFAFNDPCLAERLCEAYFPTAPRYIGPRGYYIANYLKHTCDMHGTPASTLIVSASGERAYALHLHSTYAMLRNTKSDALLRGRTPSQAGAEIAAAVGNTVSLMNTDCVLLDNTPPFNDASFVESFSQALRIYLGDSMPKDLSVEVSHRSLPSMGAVYCARRKYYKSLIDKAETEISNEFLSN